MKKRQILAVLFMFFLSVHVFAETAYIPPQSPQVAITRAPAGTPVDINLQRGGYNFSNNTLNAGAAQAQWGGNRPQFSGATGGKGTSGGTATKTNPVTMTGTYGEKATGSVRTQTTLPSNSSLSRGFGAMAVGAMATAHHQSLQNQGVADQISRGFSDGDWGAVAAGIGKMMDWTGIGGIYAQALYGNPAVQQQVMAPMQQQTIDAARQQYEAYRQAAEADPANYQQYVYISIVTDHPNNSNRAVQSAVLKVSGKPTSGSRGWFNNRDHGQSFTVDILGADFSYEFPQGNSFVIFDYRPATMQDIIDAKAGLVPPEIAYPTEAQWAAAMEAFLNSGHATNEAIRDLANALWASGGLNPNNTQTTVIGGDTANTFLSAPYTPVGAQTAQQTQFTVHPDGTVSSAIVNRPDLAAHTSQAPTRSPVETPAATAPNPTKESPTQEKPDICAANPNSIMCADMGSGDYEDLSLPQTPVNVGIKYVPYFGGSGKCPDDAEFSWMKTQYRLSYAPVCKIADMLNPVVQIVGLAVAAAIAFAAVREL